jgi:RNA polymerase sigma-70 factor (ECF subfamily)
MENSVPDHSPMPEEWMQSRERTRILQAGMEKLSPDHRAVLDLVFYQGLSLNETAEVCGCPVGTVKSRLSYARNFLKGVLTRQEDLL